MEVNYFINCKSEIICMRVYMGACKRVCQGSVHTKEKSKQDTCAHCCVWG